MSQFYLRKFLCGLVLLSLGCCTKSLQYTWIKPDYQPPKFSKIAVFGLIPYWQVRYPFEENMVYFMNKLGYAALPGFSIVPRNQKPPTEADIGKVRQMLLEQGYDGVLTIAIVDRSRRVHFEPGGTYVVPAGVARFGRYYYQTYRHVYEPSYYSESVSMIFENHFYDLTIADPEKALIWAAQNQIFDAASPQTARSQSKRVVKTLVKDGIL